MPRASVVPLAGLERRQNGDVVCAATRGKGICGRPILIQHWLQCSRRGCRTIHTPLAVVAAAIESVNDMAALEGGVGRVLWGTFNSICEIGYSCAVDLFSSSEDVPEWMKRKRHWLWRRRAVPAFAPGLGWTFAFDRGDQPDNNGSEIRTLARELGVRSDRVHLAGDPSPFTFLRLLRSRCLDRGFRFDAGDNLGQLPQRGMDGGEYTVFADEDSADVSLTLFVTGE